MRRLIVIALMFSLLPFQFVWGAAASYCQHEQGTSVEHFGHHAHKHQGKSLQSSVQVEADGKGVVGDDDTDCASCHLSFSPLAQTPLVVPADGVESILPGRVDVHPPLIANVIERPNWTLAA